VLASAFLYGTLMPGHLRWGLIAPFAVSSRAARVDGQLYDTGRGWPAARFAAPLGVAPVAGPDAVEGATVPGWLVELAPTAAAALLAQLDEVEGAAVAWEPASGAPAPLVVPGFAGSYRRVRVRTADGDEAWAYEALAVEATWVALDRWSSLEEN